MVRNKNKKTGNKSQISGTFKPAKINIGKIAIPEHVLKELNNSYKLFQSYFPTLEKFKETKILQSLEHGLLSSSEFPSNTDEVYVKVVHLLNPDDWIQGNYSFTHDPSMPGLTDGWGNIVDKLQCDENQAYIDTIAVATLSQLREQNLSPHFVKFYGAVCAKADKYCYNISDEFQSYRNTKWFWQNFREKSFGIRVFSEEKDRFLTEDEVTPFLLTPEQAELLKEEDEDEHEDEEVLEDLQYNNNDNEQLDSIELESIDSIGNITGSVRSIFRVSPSNHTINSNSENEEEEGQDFFVEFDGMPVMLIFMEKLKGVMDELLDDCTINENKWIAWIWQVICALIQAYAYIELYHNDLHGNNLLYKETEEEFIYYRTKDNQVWKVPTFGKIFCLIDYGRSIYRVGGQQLISDEFFEGNGAAGQYNFGPIRDPKNPPILPNQSFDLVRLAVSIFDTLFKNIPTEKSGPMVGVLSREGSWVVKETESPLYNLLWSWMIDDSGKNVLRDKDGDERFPGFDLYKHITAHCKGAVPKEQIRKPIFEKFKYTGVVPEGVTVYPLFV